MSMKKIVLFIFICILLAGCNSDPSDHSSPSTSALSSLPTQSLPEYSMPSGPVTFMVYGPNDDYDGFAVYEMTIPTLDPDVVFQLLFEYGAISTKVQFNSAEVIGDCLYLDVSESLYLQLIDADQITERLMMGSIVNSFLSAYGVEKVMITSNQQIMDSAHRIYDSPLEYYE